MYMNVALTCISTFCRAHWLHLHAPLVFSNKSDTQSVIAETVVHVEYNLEFNNYIITKCYYN